MGRYSSDREEKLLERIIETDGIKKIQEAITAVIFGSVDVSDRPSRLLGVVYGSDGITYQPLRQRVATHELLVQLRGGGVEIGLANPLHTQIVYGGKVIDPTVIRLLDAMAGDSAMAYGDQYSPLRQRTTTFDLLVQLRSAGVEIDPRQIRALTASDIVTVQEAIRTSLKTQPEREDLTSLGGVASSNNAGVQIIAGVAGQKLKVYDAGFHGAVDGLHYFYFGTSTTPTTKRFCTTNLKGLIHKTFVQPRISASDDGLYLFSSVSETNMPYDVGCVQEA